MKLSRLSSLTAVALATGLVSHAHAVQVTGKGGSCSAIWDSGTAAVAVSATGKPSLLTCNDGDSTCDADGQPNGVCMIDLNACAGVAVGTCTPGTLTSLKFNGPAKKLGFVAAPTAGTCGAGTVLSLPLKRVPKNPNKKFKKFNPSKKMVLLMKSKGFLNKLAVQCLPPGVGSCPLRTDDPTFPAQITLTTPVATDPNKGNGSDLDNGWTGTSHNFPVIGGSKLTYCLSGCDGKTTFQCAGTGTTKLGTGTTTNPIVNGLTFGAPLPLLTTGVPVCVINRYQDPQLTGTFNLQTGEAGAAGSPNEVKLFSDVWLRTKFPGEVCPRCNVPGGNGAIGSTGTCSSSASNAGAPCRVDGEVSVAGGGQNPYLLSSDCSPLGDNPQPNGTLDIQLKFTTGSTSLAGPLPCRDSAGPQTQDDNCGSGSCTATCTGSACVGTNDKGECIDAKGGIAQLCCSNNTATPCFPTRGGGTITRTGTPGTNGQTMVNATTFCIARTESTLINATTGLPGPGTLLLPAEVKVTP
jgi:hypothetical protein